MLCRFSQVELSVTAARSIEATMYYQTQFDDMIRFYETPVARADEIAYRIRVPVATDWVGGLSLIMGQGL